MLKSMTGYGHGEASAGEKKAVVEVRSVNHRFLDVSVRLLRTLMPLEKEIKKIVSTCTLRGKVDVYVQLNSAEDTDSNVTANQTAAKHIYDLLQQLKKEADIPGEITMETLLFFKDILFEEKREDVVDLQDSWKAIKSALELALEAQKQLQSVEGVETETDIKQRLKAVTILISEIGELAPESLAARRQTLRERVAALCEDVDVNEDRMLQEIAVMADKCDISEELVRAKSHIKQFLQWINSTDEPVGRKLEFLLQEINREANTISSKSFDSEIALKIVSIKNELEKIREQIQNIM